MRSKKPLNQEQFVGMLLEMGFILVLDTTESYHGSPKKVCRGQCVGGRLPCWDRTQGLTAVYDLDRRPWVRAKTLTPREHGRLRMTWRQRGAYVPHANDGGVFLQGLRGVTQ